MCPVDARKVRGPYEMVKALSQTKTLSQKTGAAMRNILHRIHEWATRVPVARFHDSVLGELVLNESAWECSLPTNDGPITLMVGGR